MNAALTVIFQPFIFLIEQGYSLYLFMTDSQGLAILLTSATFSIAIFPLQRWCKRYESGISARYEKMKVDVALLDSGLRGEKRFNQIEKIYAKHGYHPIQSILLGLSFFVAIPFLIASLLIFNQPVMLTGASFLFIADLSLPDSTLHLGEMTVNLLPILLFVFTYIDAWFRYRDSPSTKNRFLLISIVLMVLVYAMPAGLLLYWIGANAMSFVIYQVVNFRKPVQDNCGIV